MRATLSRPISAPILMPGTQHQPTIPAALGPTINNSIIHITGANHDGSSTSGHFSHTRVSTISTTGANTYLPLHQAIPDLYNQHHDQQQPQHRHSTGVQSGLGRFASIGNTKRLTNENATLRSKITELERYLSGLKEELLLAHCTIRAKNLEVKQGQERKALEIHELGQHIQRCEYDLHAKTAECEALQNKLAYQTKEQVTKLKHISMLETEIMDFRRMSGMSGNVGVHGRNSLAVTSSTPGISSRQGALFRNSCNSSELSESARSSALLLQYGNAQEEAQEQIRQLKEDNARKDEQIRVLQEQMGKVQRASVEKHRVYGSDSSVGFDSTSDLGVAAPSLSATSVNSVGYDVSSEHPKLIARYQALRMQHAQASVCLDVLESENQQLKVQLLNISAPLSSSVSTSPPQLPKHRLGPGVEEKPLTVDDDPKTTSPLSALSASVPSLNRKSSLRYTGDGQKPLNPLTSS
ncbi:hypothetical protein BGZ68_005464 [Mortierella alpina]|nr:hypothetical protein BGZ68_005464 [Mortierella alpina]